MIPQTIRANLARLRRRERLLLLASGLARWLAVVLVLLLVCGFVDWLIDRDRETPWAIRLGLFLFQAIVTVGTGFAFVVRPQLRRFDDAELALWVEDKEPNLRHRLVSAVQLNRPGADTAGMSPELITAVTREAEQTTAGMRFAGVADHGRLKRGAAALAPVALVALAPLLLWPGLSTTLLGRHFLGDYEVPRSIRLTSAAKEVYPAGEKVQLLYRVESDRIDEDWEGEVLVAPDGQPRDRFPLTFVRRADDGAALFGVELPPASADFVHSAKLGDGRTRRPHRARFVPRPDVQKHDIWVQLPAACGLRPDGKPYEQPKGLGDVVGIPGSSVRVAVQASKPLRAARLELLGPVRHDPAKSDEEQGPEEIKRTVPMTVNGPDAGASFDLRPGETAYRVVVEDEYEFANVPPPRRALRLEPEEPPQVALLKDYFGGDADTDLEGLPVPLGRAVRIPYASQGPYGLGQARVLYRVLKKRESASDAPEDPWVATPLPEVVADAERGPFDPRRGVFQNSTFLDEVPFHAVPSPKPDVVLPRTLGGGRYFLKTDGLLDGKGKAVSVRAGDQIEYCVEVVSRSGQKTARSETRVTTVVSPEELRAWTRSVLREEEQIRKLDSQQRGVFAR